MKTALIVDTANLYNTVGKQFNRRKIDYNKLEEQFGSDIRFAFGTRTKAEAKGFIDNLKKLGYMTTFVLAVPGKSTSLNVDMTIAALSMMTNVTRIIFATNDRDMIPLYTYLRMQGISVHVVGCGLCKDVKYSVDGFIEIDEEMLERTLGNEATKSTT
jgi:uncharacterized LabA/DUF88 family protein